MQQYSFLFYLAFTFFMLHPAKAQQFDKLNELQDYSVKVYYSAGHEQRASSIANRVDKALNYQQQQLGFKPSVILLVLSISDWSNYTSFPVYGMPHYNDDKTLIVAAEDNPFWKSFLPPLEQLPPALSEQIQTVYRRSDGNISMEAFFDLLALHELGHAFHFQGGLTMQRKWMGELFANILLHTYVAENEPEQLPALTLFPRMVISGGTKEFTYTSLKDIEERYDEIGQWHPKNYGWYQSRWHAAAGNIYDAGGKSICSKLWEALKNNKEVLTDEELLRFLGKIHTSISDMMKNWDSNTVR